jgi:hypothetical protein
MSPVTLPPSLNPRLRFGNGDPSASAAGKEPTPSNSTAPAPTPVPTAVPTPEKKDASDVIPPVSSSPGSSSPASPKKGPWQRFQDWRKQRAEAKKQAVLAAGDNPKKMTTLNLGLLIASSVILGALGVKGCDSAINGWGKKTDSTQQVDPHAGAPHASDPHHPPASGGGAAHDPHHPPATGGHVGPSHGAPATGVTAAPASATALRPIEGKILGFYFQSAELCEKALTKNRTKLIAGIREHGKQFEPPLGLGDVTQVEAGLTKAKEAMAASGVTYDFVTKNAAAPSAAQAKAFRDYIVAAQKARILLEQATPAMLFLPSGITTAPHPAAQLHQDLAGLIESSGFEDAYMELLGKLGRGTAGYQSPWGLTLENMAQDIKRNPWP